MDKLFYFYSGLITYLRSRWSNEYDEVKNINQTSNVTAEKNRTEQSIYFIDLNSTDKLI